MSLKAAILKLIIILSIVGHSADGKDYDWLVIYYMPYDNNLSPVATDIIKQFRLSKIPDNVCIALQVDLAGQGGMTRYIFSSKVDSMHIEKEQSASKDALDDYLFWLGTTFKAKHHAIVLLNHGGGLNEYGLDDYPTTDSWMGIDSLSSSIRSFNYLAGISKLDLLFEQVCARATVENLFQFREVANYTLASQDLVPTPNFYYGRVFSDLEDVRIDSGGELADLIVKSERDDMYYSYTLVDNSKWRHWMRRLSSHTKRISRVHPGITRNDLRFVSYAGEMYFDFVSLLKAASAGIDTRWSYSSLKTCTEKVLIKQLYVNSKSDRMTEYSGLSVFSPFTVTGGSLDIYGVKAFSDFLAVLKKSAKKN